jgi:hypothetical protein
MTRVTDPELIEAVKSGKVEGETSSDGAVWMNEDDVECWHVTRASKEI